VKLHLPTVVAAIALAVTPAYSQTVISNSGAQSGSSASVQSQTGSQAQSSLTFNTPSEQTIKTEQSGTANIRNVPSLYAPSMSSGHPCGLGSSLGIVVLGGGISGGTAKVDDACLLAQMGHNAAATRMIAARSPAACKALRESGDIPASSLCTRAEMDAAKKQQTAAAQPAAASAGPGGVQCIRDAKGKVIRIVRAASVTDAEARAACK